jgi:hypothetical protein
LLRSGIGHLLFGQMCWRQKARQYWLFALTRMQDRLQNHLHRVCWCSFL